MTTKSRHIGIVACSAVIDKIFIAVMTTKIRSPAMVRTASELRPVDLNNAFSPAAIAATIPEPWAPRMVARLGDFDVMVVKVKGTRSTGSTLEP